MLKIFHWSSCWKFSAEGIMGVEDIPPGGIMGVEDIQPELMLEIFSRLPIRSLFRIRSVCKQWEALSRDPRLPAMQLARASASREEEAWILTYSFDILRDRSNLELATLHSSISPKRHVHFPGWYRVMHSCEGRNLELATLHSNTSPKRRVHFPGWCRVMHSCEGLLLCCAGRNQQLFVSNPLTREHLTLPPATPTAICLRWGLGFDSSINKYKVVCFYYEDIDLTNKRWGRSCARVYSIGATVSSSWRDIMSQPTAVIDDTKNSVYANGARHWLVDHHLSPKTMVISFDFEREEFKTIARQELFSVVSRSSDQLVDLRGYLGMANVDLFGNFEIWKLKDYEKNQWVREYKFHLWQADEVLGFLGEDEIVLLAKFQGDGRVTTVFAYNSKTYALRDIYRYTRGPRRLFLPRGSLVSLSANH